MNKDLNQGNPSKVVLLVNMIVSVIFALLMGPLYLLFSVVSLAFSLSPSMGSGLAHSINSILLIISSTSVFLLAFISSLVGVAKRNPKRYQVILALVNIIFVIVPLSFVYLKDLGPDFPLFKNIGL